MPLDSGLNAHNPRYPRHLYISQSGYSFAENIPLQLLRGSVVQKLRQTISGNEAYRTSSIGLCSEDAAISFCEFSGVAAKEWRIWQAFYQPAARALFLTPASYPSSLARLVRDHWLWRWYEFVMFFRGAQRACNSEETIIFDSRLFEYAKYSYAFKSIGERDLIVASGPSYIAEGGVDTFRFESSIDDGIEAFNRSISSAWAALSREDRPATIARSPREDFTLYSNEYLTRAAFGRLPIKSRQFLERTRDATYIIPPIANFLDSEKIPATPALTYKLVAAALACCKDYRQSASPTNFASVLFRSERSVQTTIPFRDIRHRDRDPTIVRIAWNKDGLKLRQKDGKEDKDVSSVFERRLNEDVASMLDDAAFTTWQMHVYECLVIVRNWLNSKFGLLSDLDAGEIAIRDFKKVGDRLARFCCYHFHSDEATIYRLNYASPHLAIERYGAYSGLPDGDKRLRAMENHMRSIANSPETRKASISYRCVERNATQYSAFFDQEKRTAIPADQLLTFPVEMDAENWGVSACAIPIRMHGLVWGALELISTSPHNYSPAKKAKLEELATIISPFFFYQTIFFSINEINRLTLGDEGSVASKAGALCGILKGAFLSDGVSIIVIGTEEGTAEQARFFGTSDQGLWKKHKLDRDESEAIARELTRAFSASIEVFQGRLGEGRFAVTFPQLSNALSTKRSLGKEICVLPIAKSSGQGWRISGAVCLTFPLTIVPHEKWDRMYMFLTRYLAIVIDTLYSRAAWDTGLRHQVGHELSRISRMLEGATKELRGAVIRAGLQDPLERQVYSSLHDVEKAAAGASWNARLLRRPVDPSDVLKDQMLLSAELRAAKERNEGPWPAIDVREVFNAAFKSRKKEAGDRQIHIEDVPHVNYPLVRAPEWLLDDVMGSLADNAIKYGKPNAPVIVGIRIVEGALWLSIRNMGPELFPEDLDRIFEEGYRGAFARNDSGMEGQGRGLWYARELMRLINGYLNHEQRSPSKRQDRIGKYEVVWHEFELVFPSEICEERPQRWRKRV